MRRIILAVVAASLVLPLALVLPFAAGCDRKPKAQAPGGGSGGAAGPLKTVGVSFDTLQTEYWVASMDTIKAELAAGEVMLKHLGSGEQARVAVAAAGPAARGLLQG